MLYVNVGSDLLAYYSGQMAKAASNPTPLLRTESRDGNLTGTSQAGEADIFLRQLPIAIDVNPKAGSVIPSQSFRSGPFVRLTVQLLYIHSHSLARPTSLPLS